MNPAADQLALELARWSWYARDALAGAELAHDACAERVRRLGGRTDTAVLVAQRLRRRGDDEGQRLAGALAALVGSRRRSRERSEALSASLARVEASVAHWTAQLRSAEHGGDAQSARCQACRRALHELGEVRRAMLGVCEDHARIEATIDDADRAMSDAAAALQEARTATIDAADPSASLPVVAGQLLSQARGHLDVARMVHDEAQRLAAGARHRVSEHAGRGAGSVAAVDGEHG